MLLSQSFFLIKTLHLKFFFVCLITIIFCTHVYAEGPFIVSGKVTKNGSGVEKVPLALLKFIQDAPKGTPPMAPVGRTDTDKNGNYRFEVPEATPEDTFVVGILFEGKRESSKQFSFKDTVTHTENFNYETPKAELIGKIHGTLTMEGQILKNTQMALLRMLPDPQGGPSIEPVRTAKTDEKGRYVFNDIASARKDIYVIGIAVQDDRYSSKRLTFEDKDTLLFNIDLLGKVKDAKFFAPEQRSFVITYFVESHSLKVTDFVSFRNTSDRILDLRKNPITFNLPANATNPIHYPMDNISDNIVFENGEVKAGIYADSPTGQFVYEYDITGDIATNMQIEMSLVEGTKQVEVIYPINALNVSVVDIFSSELVKNIGNIEYGTRIIEPDANQTTITLRIEKLPIRQEYMVFYISLFLIPLGVLVMVFIKRKKSFLKK